MFNFITFKSCMGRINLDFEKKNGLVNLFYAGQINSLLAARHHLD